VNQSFTRKNFIARLTAAAAVFGLTGKGLAATGGPSSSAAISTTKTEALPVVVKIEQRAVARRADSV
jgi:hypothetical protein